MTTLDQPSAPLDLDAEPTFSFAIGMAMLDNSPANMMFADRDLIIRYVNKASLAKLREIEEWLPVNAADIVGSHLDIFHKNPEYQRGILASDANLPRTSLIQVGPELLDLTVTAIHDLTGCHIGAMATWDIVTEKVRLEREAARLSAMVENAPINMMFADRDLVIRYLNPASLAALRTVEQHLPVTADEVVGSHLDIFHKKPEYQQRILADAGNLPRSAHISVGPETLDLLVTAIHDQHGEHIGAMATWSVVTEQLRVQEEKAALEAAEAERVAEERARNAETAVRVGRLMEAAEAAAAGDLAQQLDDGSDDNVGHMAGALNHLFSGLRSSLQEINLTADALAESAQELASTAQGLDRGAAFTSERAANASSAAVEVSSSIQSVASAAEEMTASIREIARNASDASVVAQEASRSAGAAQATVTELGTSSAEIGEVIKVITSIAQQTNLLALNATIEAARAGDAGKGFAVVANEVKELAKETATATESISQKIEAIQDSTGQAVKAIAQIAEVIERINDTTGTIASAVEEQTATTNDIARSVTEAAAGAGSISEEVTQVATAAGETNSGAQTALNAAQSLTAMAVQLKALVSKFHL